MKTLTTLNSEHLSIDLVNSSYLDKCRFLENRCTVGKREIKTVSQILRISKDKVHINVWFWRNTVREDENCGIVIASLEFYLEKNQRQSIEISIPKTKDWDPIYFMISATNKCHLSVDRFNSVNREKTTVEADGPHEHIIAKWETFPSPEEAKKQFKYIKRHHLVSKFYWDPQMNMYDCYCKACAVDGVRVGGNTFKFTSWVGNPDIGYVRPVGFKCDKNDGVFKYASFGGKGILYEPVAGEEYERLQFYSEKEYEEIAKKCGLTETFDELWAIKLHSIDIYNNGNIKGGAWRHIQFGDVVTNADEMNNACLETVNKKEAEPVFEKVVTLGWHRTNPKNAVRCPVCDDLYTIICRSGYNPLPKWRQLLERISVKWYFFTRKIAVYFADRKYYKEHPDDC